MLDENPILKCVPKKPAKIELKLMIFRNNILFPDFNVLPYTLYFCFLFVQFRTKTLQNNTFSCLLRKQREIGRRD